MDYRKLISFGKGGYVISIPKDWVVENKLEKGNFITMERDGSTLRLTVDSEQQKNPAPESETGIDVDGVPLPILYRQLRSAYLNSNSTIVLRGEELKDKREELKKRIDKLIALEIFESSRNRIVLKDLMNFNNIDFLKDFRKMDITLRSMIIDLKKLDPSLYESIETRDDDVDRMFFLLLKALKKGMKDREVMKKFGLDPSKAMNYWVYVYSLENFGDELTNLMHLLRKQKFTNETKKYFFEVYGEMERLYLETMKVIYTDNFKASFDLAEEHKRVLKERFKMHKSYFEPELMMALNTIENMINITYLILRNYYY